MQDRFYMKQAIELAKLGRFTTDPNPNVGCLIVKNAQIIGKGFHAKAGCAHAEVNALLKAGKDAAGSTVYVTMEPCSHHGKTPPCTDALIKAGVSKVVIAMQDPNPQVVGRGIVLLQQAGIEVNVGLLEDEAKALNRGFLKRMRSQKPYIRLKIAASLDGRTAMTNGESKWITSPAARQDVQQYRAESSAILTTSQTVLADDPAMTVRWNELPESVRQDYPQSLFRPPLRVIIDSQNRVNSHYKILQQPGETLLVRSITETTSASLPHVSELIQPLRDNQTDLSMLLDELAKREINTVWVEAGAKLAGALIDQKLVDELIIYIAPKILGDQARPLCYLPQSKYLSQVPQFIFSDIQKVGDDVRLTLLADR